MITRLHDTFEHLTQFITLTMYLVTLVMLLFTAGGDSDV